MPELAHVACVVNTLAACVALVSSGLINVTQNDRMRGQIAAYILQKRHRSVNKKNECEERDVLQTEKDISVEKDLEHGIKTQSHRKRLLMKFERSYKEDDWIDRKNQKELTPVITKCHLSDVFQNKVTSVASYQPKHWRERKRREMCPSCSHQSTKEGIMTKEHDSGVYNMDWPSWYERKSAKMCPICCWKTKKFRKRTLSRRTRSHSTIFSMILPSSTTGTFSIPSAQTFKKCLSLVSERVKREHAARIIQRWYCCKRNGWFLATVWSWNTPSRQRQEVIRDLMKHAASVVIQRWFRHHRKRRYALHYVHLHASAYYIQKWIEQQWLRWHMLHYVHMCAAAVAIQKWYRKMKKIGYMNYYVHLCHKANLIKRWYVSRKVWTAIGVYAERKAAVIKIEKWWIRLKKAKLIEKYAFSHKNAIKIQRWYRKELKIKYMLKYANRYRAAVVLQRGVRNYMKIQSIYIYIYLQDHAFLIQQWYRRVKKRQYILHYLHLQASALVIQSWYKKSKKIGYILHYLHLNAAASTIQRWYRACALSMKLLHYAHAVAAAYAIQHWYFVRMKRRQLRIYLFRNSRRTILNNYKEFWKNASVNYLKQRCKSRLLRRWYKDKTKRKFILDYFRMDRAAVKIQRWYRNATKRQLILDYLERQCVACKMHRGYISRRKWINTVEMVLEKRRKTRLKKKAARTLRQRYIEMELAASTIQRAYRGWIGIKKALSAISRSMHNWYYSVDEDEIARAYHENRIRNMKYKRMCDSCTLKKLYSVSSKIRIASLIFIHENAVIIIQRWWRRIRIANAILDVAHMMQVFQIAIREEPQEVEEFLRSVNYLN